MFSIFYADCTGREGNCLYPHRAEITDKASLAEAVSHDYVCAEYKGGYRSNDNFITSNCLAIEFDNDHTDDPDKWVYPRDLRDALPGVSIGIHFSRNHMKEKNGRIPRPKFHAFMEIDPITDHEEYKAMKKQVAAIIPHADPNAMDAARFFYGTADPEVEFFPGTMTLTEFFETDEFDADMGRGTYGEQAITEGRRNATLSRKAGKLVKRYGVTEEAHEAFLQEAAKCDPPLEDAELAKIWASASRFAKKVQSQEGYIPPDQYKGAGNLKPSDYSDIGQAKVVAMDCANELIYTPGTEFLRYNGKYWEESKQKAVGLVIDFLDRQLADAETVLEQAKERLVSLGVSEQLIASGGKALEKQIQESQMQAYFALLGAISYKAFVMKRRDMKYVTSAMQAAKPMVEIDQHTLDVHENLLNCPDGTYDLSKGMNGRRDHDSSDLITKITPYAPSDVGKELWLDAIDKTFQGNAELIDYVQRIVGLAAIGEVYQEIMVIAYGDGSNGKSTFWNTIAGAMGSYGGLISADTLTVGCKRNVKPELAEVKGMRILIAAELEEGQRLSTSVVKQLSSTDLIEGEKKYKDPFKFRPTHTLILYTNHLPKVGAMDTGIWRRLIVIPFNATITGSGDIKNYSKYLLKHAGPYITKWIIEGAEKVIHDTYKLKTPAVVRDAIARYKADNDWMSHFLDECCEVGDGLEEKSGELYSSYRAYCARSSEFIRSTTEFYKTLDQRGFSRHKTNKGSFVRGLKLSGAEAEF